MLYLPKCQTLLPIPRIHAPTVDRRRSTSPSPAITPLSLSGHSATTAGPREEEKGREEREERRERRSRSPSTDRLSESHLRLIEALARRPLVAQSPFPLLPSPVGGEEEEEGSRAPSSPLHRPLLPPFQCRRVSRHRRKKKKKKRECQPPFVLFSIDTVRRAVVIAGGREGREGFPSPPPPPPLVAAIVHRRSSLFLATEEVNGRVRERETVRKRGREKGGPAIHQPLLRHSQIRRS